MSRLVHFVYLGGPLKSQHFRAIETARVHEAPIWIWTGAAVELRLSDVPRWLDAPIAQVRSLDVPTEHLKHPIQLANVKDYYAWKILHDHGGLYLDLDTISLQPCWDLLTRQVCVSSEHEPGFTAGHPYNSAVVLGEQGAPILNVLAQRAASVLKSDEERWGKCGPHLLTDVVAQCPDAFDIAPFGVLNGWRDDTIHRYYDGERPGADVRVAHLFSSSRPDLFAADYWMP